MNEIKPRDIMHWQNKLLSAVNKNDEPYSETYLRTINNQLVAIFSHACKFYGLKSNPATKAGAIGKKHANTVRFWTRSEYEAFSKAIRHEPVTYYAFQVLYWTGMRIGELLALTVGDIDFLYANPLLDEAIAPAKARISFLLKNMADNICDELHFASRLAELFSLIGYDVPADEDVDRLLETASDATKYAICYQNKSHHCLSLTYHSSKGLEFPQVVLFVEDYNLENEDDINNHYVASTRAEEKLILVSRNDSLLQRYSNQMTTILAGVPVQLSDIIQRFARP